ncbi:hypothetical protein BYT27DRAFT_7192832 [Phlegmacium glaucopus]|nr:hypothetical protein BYT27DRAFT_7192832 [Phlegmacium glaucopus]
MPDIKQANLEQNTQLAGEEGRRPSLRQENEPTIAQHPMSFSIQSISDPDPSSDQSFKLRDRNYVSSANSSTVKSVNPKKFQNPPQEIRSNQETTHQAVEFETVEPQKGEQVDPQEGGHDSAPFHDLDQNPLIPKPQEFNSDRYTHDQDENTAQWELVENNKPGQHPNKTHLSSESKSKHREREEIEPQEVENRDVVPINSPLRRCDSELSLSSRLTENKMDNPSSQKINQGKLAAKSKKSSPLAFWKETLGRQVKTEMESQDDVIIAVIGPSGSGKSTFIKIATGSDTDTTYNSESRTSGINIVKMSAPELTNGDVIFVDTPGFNDTHKSDTEILKMLAEWLRNTYGKKTLLSGLLYFHRMCNDRMPGAPLKNLRKFEDLCGKNAFHNVIFTTTMWDEVDKETGCLRENKLKSGSWQSMLDRGSTTGRFLYTRESALGLIKPFIDARNSLLQQEMEDNSQKMKATGKANKDRNPEKKTSGGSFSLLKGALARLVETDDLSPDDIIIAVMGPTGSGKSTFINIITDFEIGVGHNLESCTNEVNNVRISMPELAYGDLVFVDTPGFDDTNKSDVDILKMVADWLKSTYAKNILLSGLLYFHRITDNRMAGTPLKNLRMFEELCGKNSFQNVILATTMWDDIDNATGAAREEELKSKYWRAMLDRNSTTGRFLRTRESAFALIDPLIDAANTRSSVLLQQEMVDMRKKLPATSAGQKLFSEMEHLVMKREELLQRIRNEMKHADGDKMALEPLREEHEKLKVNLESTVNEMRRLKLPLGQRLVKMTENFSRKITFSFFKSMKSKPSSAY